MGEKISGYTGISTSTFADDDLFDISVFTGSGYVTRKITGAQLKAGLSSSSLATDDQVIDEAERNIDLNGTSETDKLNIRNSLGDEIAEFRGDGYTFLEEASIKRISLGMPVPTTSRISINSNNSQYGVLVTPFNGVAPSFAAFGASTSGSLGSFYANKVALGFNAEDVGNSSTVRKGFRAVMQRTNTSDNVGIELNVKNGANNYAIDVVNGDIRVDGEVGLSDTYTFGGGSSGDVATMKFKNGILVEVTTVP